ncbi:MAG: lysine biosynthesis protein LysX/ribosomal protein modification protein RimK, partial [Streptosporangiaceae bacterium]|nr:lysine biosynthesis protein LysX/ribosomal protein modification protein RimK [Streptosporangiaceae bacterium]
MDLGVTPFEGHVREALRDGGRARPLQHRHGEIDPGGLGGEMYATERSSPLHPDRPVRERQVPLSAEVAGMVAEVGTVYG